MKKPERNGGCTCARVRAHWLEHVGNVSVELLRERAKNSSESGLMLGGSFL